MRIGEPSLNPPESEPDYNEYIDTHHGGICPECGLESFIDETDHYDCGEAVKEEAALERALSRLDL